MMVGEADAVAVAFMRKALRAEPIALP